MTAFFSAVFADCSLRRVLSLPVVICLLSCVTNCLAQHHSGQLHGQGMGGPQYFGGGGAYNRHGMYNGSGPYVGLYNYNYGGFNANGPQGGVSFGNGFGTATYSQRNFGVTTYGVNGGGFNHGVRDGLPVIWSTPIANYSPSVFGYGSGVFSPTFPSGNYISNGYVGFVPSGAYEPWCHAGWPTAVGMNSYFPGTGIAPTVLMLNLDLNIQPMESSALLIDPRVIDQLAPAVNPAEINPNGVEPAPVPQPPEPGDAPVRPDAPPLPNQPDDVPVLNEFSPVPRDQKVSSLADKIRSLRYQASGDDAFHKSDYATADVFYATAISTAPDRRAPYLRMAMVRIALADFPNATGYLKAGLLMESDASRPWCTAEELYGQKVAERARSHGGPLWNWLAARPMSADRLLLAGTFQKLRGYNKTADEMLALASHEGTEANLVSEVTHLAATDIGQRAVSDDLEQMIEQASAHNKTSGAAKHDAVMKLAVDQAGGIFMRGKSVATRTDDTAPVQQPIATPDIESNAAPIPFEIPLPDQN